MIKKVPKEDHGRIQIQLSMVLDPGILVLDRR